MSKESETSRGAVMPPTRRTVLKGIAAGTALSLPVSLSGPAWAVGDNGLRTIPSSGEQIPSVGLGSAVTFNVGSDQQALDRSTEVVRAFLQSGGRLIDTSPMYGSAQTTIGQALDQIEDKDHLFSADKVFIRRADRGAEQIEASRKLWGIPTFDLLQVHNLVSWEPHLETLFAMKEKGALRYVGITTSHGRRHKDFARIMESYPLDFVQLTYNIVERAAEQRLLPLAKERGIAVICNRPFGRKTYIDRAKRHALPEWASELGIDNWASFLLRYITSHEAVTCAIPATTNPDHARENLTALKGVPLTEVDRSRMVQTFRSF